MIKVLLYGDLKEKYGSVFTLHTSSLGETIRALDANNPGFMSYIGRPGMAYRVLVNGEEQSEATVRYPIGSNSTINIIPVPAGAKSAAGQIVTGAILIGLAVATGGAGVVGVQAAFSQVAMGIGVGLVAGGIAALLMPSPSIETGEEGEELTSSKFNGPVNTTKQGNPIPLGYGKLLVGGQVISAGLSTVDKGAQVPGGSAVDSTYGPLEASVTFNQGQFQYVPTAATTTTIVIPDETNNGWTYTETAFKTPGLSIEQPESDFGYFLTQGGSQYTAFGRSSLPNEYYHSVVSDAAILKHSAASVSGATDITMSLWVEKLTRSCTLASIGLGDEEVYTSGSNSKLVVTYDNNTKELFVKFSTHYIKVSLDQYTDDEVYPTPIINSSTWDIFEYETLARPSSSPIWKHLAISMPTSGTLRDVKVFYQGRQFESEHYSYSTTRNAAYSLTLSSSVFIGGESWAGNNTYTGHGIDNFRLYTDTLGYDKIGQLLPYIRLNIGDWLQHYRN